MNNRSLKGKRQKLFVAMFFEPKVDTNYKCEPVVVSEWARTKLEARQKLRQRNGARIFGIKVFRNYGDIEMSGLPKNARIYLLHGIKALEKENEEAIKINEKRISRK
jgi:hypothetical protein